MTIVDRAGDARIWVRGELVADATGLTLEDFRGVVRLTGSDFTLEAEGRVLLTAAGQAPPSSRAAAGTGCATTAGAAGPRPGPLWPTPPEPPSRRPTPPPGPAPPGPGRAQARSTASATSPGGTRYSPRAMRRRSDSSRADPLRRHPFRGRAARLHTENRTTITSPSAIT